jgi:hypothetical protein
MKKEVLGFQIRALTRKEIKALREQGVDLFSFEGDKAIYNVDPVLDLVYPGDKKAEDLAFPDAAKVYQAILGATLGVEEEEKNS